MAVVSRVATLTESGATGSRTWTVTASVQDTPAGQAVTLTPSTSTTGGVAPVAADQVFIDIRLDDTANQICFFEITTGLTTPVTLYLTSDGTSGGSPRAGTLRLRMHAQKTTGLAAQQYNLTSDNGAYGSPANTHPTGFSTTVADAGYIRGTTTLAQAISNASLGGADTTPYAYGDSIYVRLTSGAGDVRRLDDPLPVVEHELDDVGDPRRHLRRRRRQEVPGRVDRRRRDHRHRPERRPHRRRGLDPLVDDHGHLHRRPAHHVHEPAATRRLGLAHPADRRRRRHPAAHLATRLRRRSRHNRPRRRRQRPGLDGETLGRRQPRRVVVVTAALVDGRGVPGAGRPSRLGRPAPGTPRPAPSRRPPRSASRSPPTRHSPSSPPTRTSDSRSAPASRPSTTTVTSSRARPSVPASPSSTSPPASSARPTPGRSGSPSADRTRTPARSTTSTRPTCPGRRSPTPAARHSNGSRPRRRRRSPKPTRGQASGR
jgi:hypothetical protein